MVSKGTTMANDVDTELRTSSYELFIGALSILSIVNLVLLVLPLGDQVKELVLIVDSALTVVFVIDFTIRLFTAPTKTGYFFKGGGWLDLLGSLPGLRIFRLFRVVRVGRLLHRYGARKVVRDLLASRAQGGLLFVSLLAILTLEFGGMFVLGVEQHAPNANIRTGPEALWWGIVTITTVGYGDFYPVTNPGRVVGAIIMLNGIAVLGTLTGYLANAFLSPRKVTHAPAGPQDARSQLEEIRRQLEDNAKVTSQLHARLGEIADSLEA
jgi:voltage-gated potassium channel